jgi:hypothetical protein
LRKRLIPRARTTDLGDLNSIKRIICNNASLRVDFGWSFESGEYFGTIMKEYLQDTLPNHTEFLPQMVSDLRCSWIGFMPFNSFEKDFLEKMSLYSLIEYNNDLINFQIDVIEFIINHPIYKQHAVLRDERYRFELFKVARKNPDLLAELFAYYMEAVSDICGIESLPRDILESEIGCHFLYHPKIFFELLSFYILQGKIHE